MCADSRKAFPISAWLVASVAVVLCGCPKNVGQDSHSGKDYRTTGARKIKIENGEGRSQKDVVTYPGGDRVDWKEFEIAGDKTGTLEVELRWSPPRPNLDLAFDVYDQYLYRIARSKPTPGSGKRMKRVTIKDAGPGKYFVQVYAPSRGDAGTYRVEVEFKAGPLELAAQAPSEIPDPPTLPAIPEAASAPPAGTPPAGQTAIAPVQPAPPTVQPVKARVSKYEVSGGGTLVITIDKGKNAGVEAGWKGQVLGGTGRPVRGGEFTVSKVTGSEAQGKVGLSVDQIKSNNKVLLSPP